MYCFCVLSISVGIEDIYLTNWHAWYSMKVVLKVLLPQSLIAVQGNRCKIVGTNYLFIRDYMLDIIYYRPTSRYRPCPLNTIELQKRASMFLRMNSETTMKVCYM